MADISNLNGIEALEEIYHLRPQRSCGQHSLRACIACLLAVITLNTIDVCEESV